MLLQPMATATLEMNSHEETELDTTYDSSQDYRGDCTGGGKPAFMSPYPTRRAVDTNPWPVPPLFSYCVTIDTTIMNLKAPKWCEVSQITFFLLLSSPLAPARGGP